MFWRDHLVRPRPAPRVAALHAEPRYQIPGSLGESLPRLLQIFLRQLDPAKSDPPRPTAMGRLRQADHGQSEILVGHSERVLEAVGWPYAQPATDWRLFRRVHGRRRGRK